MKTLALVLLPYIMVGQTVFKMRADVREVINGHDVFTDSVSVIWGLHHETFEFILPSVHLVLKPMKHQSEKEILFEKHEQGKVLANEKLYIRVDEWGNKHSIRIISGYGLIIFINDYDRHYHYMIDFL